MAKYFSHIDIHSLGLKKVQSFGPNIVLLRAAFGVVQQINRCMTLSFASVTDDAGMWNGGLTSLGLYFFRSLLISSRWYRLFQTCFVIWVIYILFFCVLHLFRTWLIMTLQKLGSFGQPWSSMYWRDGVLSGFWLFFLAVFNILLKVPPLVSPSINEDLQVGDSLSFLISLAFNMPCQG